VNIFILDNDPSLNVTYHIDAHCNKIILEATQMLCTGCNLLGKTTPYKTTHINHPVSKWVRQSKANFSWTIDYARRLCSEFKFRRDKQHKCLDIVLECEKYTGLFPDITATPFVQAMPEQYQCSDAVQAYRNYYIGEKRYNKAGKNMFIWTKRQQPSWV
jgi:hypothetical protein